MIFSATRIRLPPPRQNHDMDGVYAINRHLSQIFSCHSKILGAVYIKQPATETATKLPKSDTSITIFAYFSWR